MQTVNTSTGQNVSDRPAPAAVGTRIGAFLLDTVAMTLYVVMISSALISADVEDVWIWSVFVVIPAFSFGFICEVLMNGQTPGKRIMDIHVVNLDGTRARPVQYGIRWICGLIDFIFLFGVLATILITSGRKGQRLGDMVASTYVIKAAGQKRVSANIQVYRGYSPVFPQAVHLDQYYLELINRALDASRDHNNQTPAQMVTEKLKSLLAVCTEMPASQFLTTLRDDYNHLKGR
jgi:uncharacterized RDD family membrane protein YckC